VPTAQLAFRQERTLLNLLLYNKIPLFVSATSHSSPKRRHSRARGNDGENTATQ
jgi:hypothetical protein